MRDYAQIHEGMDVLDRDGEKIGKAGETLGDYFNVDAGFLGTKEYYVPFDAVSDVTDNDVVLNVAKRDVDRMGWDERPEEQSIQSTRSTRMSTTATSSDHMLLKEEQLQARKSAIESGRIQLGKEVVEDQRTLDVPVTREEVTIQRTPVDRQPADRPIGDSDTESINVPVREERVEVDKQPVVYEEVGVGKRVRQDRQRVSDTVRREELRADQAGDVEIRKDRNP